MQVSSLNQTASAHAVRRNRFIGSLFAAALLCAAAAASAQTVQKQVDSEGRITYTDRPEAAAADSPPVQVIRPRQPRGKIDKLEASRRLQQAERAMARRAGAYRGDPPMTVGSPEERHQAKMEKLRRDLVAAQARAREVYGPDAVSEVSGSTTTSLMLAGGEGGARTR